ncbi:MAG: winged helix-turn-helix domain-containing protein [Alphaproteobacteria bacterium]|nr:winged helix-turn-helix domain-containing protein [Alphaproteobacteria bacterium]
MSEFLSYPWELLVGALIAGARLLPFFFENQALDPMRRELSRDGAVVAVEPKVFDLLVYLVTNRDRVVTKDDLIAGVWGGRIVSDSALTGAINAARRAIGDDGRAQRLIRTSSRKGYRFVGSVRLDAGTEPALALPDKPSIAILPFHYKGGDPEQEFFADGMVEDLTTEFSRIRWLFVIARNSTSLYRGQTVDVRQVARDLGVRYILEGSVRRSGNQMRLTAQLVDAISGSQIWAERYDRDLVDIFAVQDEITASVAGVIEPVLSEAEQQRVLRKPPERLDAWEAYQRGLWHFNKYGSDENQVAQTFFRRAMALDPNFAPGHHGYALALQWEIWLFSERPFSEVRGTPFEEARLAVSLDDKDATAHAVLAHMLMWRGDWEAAIAEARTALGLNPNSSFVISMLGCVLGFGGYHEEAIERLRQAMRASPNDPLTWLWTLWTGCVQFYSRQFEAAVKTLREVVRLHPRAAQCHGMIAASLAYLGRLDEARDHLSLVPFSPRFQNMPWTRPQDMALRIEGVRLAAGEPK